MAFSTANRIETEIYIRTYSGLNDRVHWRTRARRARAQRSAAFLMFPSMVQEFPITIHMQRRSPGVLDDDNLRGALKHIRDGIADKLGIKDNDPRVTWEYSQVRAKNFSVGVRVTRS